MFFPMKVFAMRYGRGFLAVLVLVLLSGCASLPRKFYDGPELAAKDTAVIFAPRRSEVYVDGHTVYSWASVLPGLHRIVVVRYSRISLLPDRKKPLPGYIDLDAKAGRSYAVRIQAADGDVRTWAVDRKTCEVVAGTRPESVSGCADPEEKIDPEKEKEENTQTILLLGLFVAAAASGHVPQRELSAAECKERCYSEPDAREEPTARFLFPPWDTHWWQEQADEDCGAFFPSHSKCLLDFGVDGLRVRTNARTLLLRPGRREVVFEVMLERGGWRRIIFKVDGISFEAKPDRVYALCLSADEDKIATWVVDNETGRVVAGRKMAFDGKKPSRYSRFCPLM